MFNRKKNGKSIIGYVDVEIEVDPLPTFNEVSPKRTNTFPPQVEVDSIPESIANAVGDISDIKFLPMKVKFG